MTLSRRTILRLAAGMAGLPAVSSSTSAQTYPTRPITIIVPFPPGGGGDNITRIVAERMRVSLGQPVIIENVSAASGSIGIGRVARASPDGYVIGFGYWGTHISNPTGYSLDYDVVNDFEPISLLTSAPWLIIARNSLPAKDLKEWIAWLKANPGKGLVATARTIHNGCRDVVTSRRTPLHLSGRWVLAGTPFHPGRNASSPLSRS